MRNLGNLATHPVFVRSCGVGGVLAGVLFLVWGYVDRPDIPAYLEALVYAFSFVVPALFSTALVGLYGRCKGRLGLLGGMGLALSFSGSVLGWTGRFDWGPILFTGLVVMGAAVGLRTIRGWGALSLVMGASGWVYYLTDSGAVLEARPVHVGFGLVFALGWMVLGSALSLRGSGRTKDKAA